MKNKIFLICLCTFFLIQKNNFAKTYFVANTNDSGSGSLRAAILSANNDLKRDTILFSITGVNWNIYLLSLLPSINDTLLIDGLSQPGSSYPSNLISINGSLMLSHGLQINSDRTTIQGLHFKMFTNGPCVHLNTHPFNNLPIKNVCLKNNFFQDSQSGILADNSACDSLEVLFNQFKNCSSWSILFNSFGRSYGFFSEGNYFNCLSQNAPAILINARIKNVVINENTIKNYITAIACTFSYLDSVRIINNHFDSAFSLISTAIGIRSLGADTLKNIDVNGNQINIPGGQIQIYQTAGGAGGFQFTNLIENIRISNNRVDNWIHIRADGTGGGMNKFSNFIIENNTCYSLEFEIGGTGAIQNEFTDVFIDSNQIGKTNFNGLFIRVIGPWVSHTLKNFNIKRNYISNSIQSGIHMQVVGNIHMPTLIDGFTVDSNLLEYNSNSGIFIGLGSFPSPLFQVKNFIIRDNGIHDNVFNGLYVQLLDSLPFKNFLVMRNSIYSNGNKGINILGPTPSVLPKVPAPVMDTLCDQLSWLSGHMQGKALRTYHLQFYYNQVPDSTGYGEGENFFLDHLVTTDTNGFAYFKVVIPGFALGTFISATATDTVLQSTSEFSNCIESNFFVSLDEFEKQEFLVAPNPSNSTLEVVFRSMINAGEISFFNVSGEKVMFKNVPKHTESISFDVSSLASGLYLIKFGDGKSVQCNRLVIQH